MKQITATNIFRQLRGDFPERRTAELTAHFLLVTDATGGMPGSYQDIVQVLTQHGISQSAAYRTASDLRRAGVVWQASNLTQPRGGGEDAANS